VARRDERGLALLSVLWVSALMATLAAGFATDTRTESRLARNHLENARAEALADAGVHHAARRLYGRDPATPWRETRTRYRFNLGGGRVSVELEDEEGKVDLNYAPPELLEGLMLAVGADPDTAGTLAARIQDYRDPDQDPMPLGAEDDDYFAAGLEHEAKDAPLLTRNELLLVLGMSEELYRRLLPHVTIFSASEAVDPLRASPTVLRAIPGMTEDAVELLLSLGPEEDPYDVLDEEVLIAAEAYFLFSNESIFMVRSTGESEHGGIFVREAVIELIGEQDRPFLVHDWRRGQLPPPGAATGELETAPEDGRDPS